MGSCPVVRLSGPEPEMSAGRRREDVSFTIPLILIFSFNNDFEEKTGK
jgi:hypothetical protein